MNTMPSSNVVKCDSSPTGWGLIESFEPSIAMLESRIMMHDHDLAIPTLPSRSIDATVEFYHRLGFEGGAHEFNRDYAILQCGSIELHFFKHAELVPADSFSGCYLRVLDVETMYQAALGVGLPRAGIPRVDILEDKPWGLREFAIVDPDGNLLRIGQVIHD